METYVPRGESIGSLFDTEFEQRKEIFGPIIQDGTLTLLYAPRGIGKTFFALQLAHAISTQSPFLKWVSDGEYKTCLFDGEMGRERLTNRFRKLDKGAFQQVRGGMMHIVTLEHFNNKMPNLASFEDQKIYRGEIGDARVVIIDNLLTCSAPENKWDDEVKMWKRIQELLLELRAKGKAVVMIHHAGKSGEQIGTSMKENIMDNIIALRRYKNMYQVDDEENCLRMEMHFEKNRNFYGEDAKPLYIEYRNLSHDEGCWNWFPLEQKNKERIKSYYRNSWSVSEIGELLNVPTGYVRAVLIDEGLIEKDGWR